MIRLVKSFGVLMISGFVATGQTSSTGTSSFLATNTFSDGSIIKLQAVSYGVIHRIVYPYGQSFFKSSSPTIMFTTSHQAAAGRHLGDDNNLSTEAEALGLSGNWYPLRRRTEPRPVTDKFENGSFGYEGPPPTEMSETWEFASCPAPSPLQRVRVWINRGSTKVSSVDFQLPNDASWRERTATEQTNGFHPQEWLGSELFRAAWQGDVDYVKDLIDQRADPNSCDSAGMSALAIACQDGHKDVLDYLLAHGADVNAHSKGKSTDRTALMAAASNDGHPAIVRLLVERGAEVNTRGELGWTALIWAAREGDVESVKYLLSKGADPSIKDQDGKSAIELTEKTVSAQRSEIVKILKDAQAAH